ncbi:MAG: AzlC family ABC transporter permease [Candidatus Adiutrix sp.]|jgi:4-azaleucine resistance transporter AzlC|nr:AzlC family ABC transporter permease [Candidatus Adiutrix sp.]
MIAKSCPGRNKNATKKGGEASANRATQALAPADQQPNSRPGLNGQDAEHPAAARPKRRDIKKAACAAFPRTIPVMTGYVFMGAAFGLLLQSVGYNFLWAGLMSVTIYAGAMQFVAVNLLAEPMGLANAFFITLMVNARHVFYGFSMLEKYKGLGLAKPYLIFSLTDETFTLLCAEPAPEGIDPKSYYLSLSLMNQLYWITGCVAGALLGSRLNMNVAGVEFVMTALFVAIFVEQVRRKANRPPALAGLGGSAACLAIFGPDHFILPAMATMVAVLTLARGPVERGFEAP